MALTTVVEIAAPVNRVHQEKFLRNAKARALYFVGSEAGELTAHRNSFTVQWRRIENLTPTTTALTALTGNLSLPTRNATQPSTTEVTATVAKYGDFIFLNEEVEVVNVNGQTMKLMEVLGIQAGRSFNRLQRNILEDNLTKIRASGATADSGVAGIITRGLIRQATNTLNRNDALMFTAATAGSTNVGTSPVRAAFWGMCHHDVEEDIRDLTGFIAAESYAGQTAIAPGEFGTVGGIRFVASSEGSIDTDTGGDPGATLRTTSGASADVYHTVVVGMECHGSVGFDTSLIKEAYMAGDSIPGVIIINNPKGSAGAGDPLNEVSSLAWKGWHTGAILNSTWGRVITTGASRLL